MARTGKYSVTVDGEWYIDDLFVLAEAVQETYAYFFFLDPAVVMEDDTRHMFVRYFWSAEYVGRRFGRDLYHRIPPEDRLRIASFTYSSLGSIDFMGVLGALAALSLVVRSWATTGEKIVELLERIRDFFRKSKLERPPKRFDSSVIRSEQIIQADQLCYELGERLGISESRVAHLIDTTGNPISALKLLVALATEARKLSNLQREGKIKLPNANARHIGQ